jgi:hypothetical protein
MNADEFLSQVTPAARRSKLAPWLADIQKLRAAGCSLKQVQAFLSANNLLISLSGLAKFVSAQMQQEPAKGGGPGRTGPQPAGSATVTEAAPVPPSATTGARSFKTRQQLADENPGLSSQTVRDLFAKQYSDNAPGSLARQIAARAAKKENTGV